MSTNTEIRIALIEARDLIALPEKWVKGTFQNGKAVCSLGAINQVVLGNPRASRFGFGFEQDPVNVELRNAVVDVLAEHATVKTHVTSTDTPFEIVAKNNDDKEATHETVLATFDAAIASLGFETTLTKVTTETKTVPVAVGDIFRNSSGSVVWHVDAVDPTAEKSLTLRRLAGLGPIGATLIVDAAYTKSVYTHLQNGVKETSVEVGSTEEVVVAHRFQVGDEVTWDAQYVEYRIDAIELLNDEPTYVMTGVRYHQSKDPYFEHRYTQSVKAFDTESRLLLTGGPRFVEPAKWEVGQFIQIPGRNGGDPFIVKVLAIDLAKPYNGVPGSYEVTCGVYGWKDEDNERLQRSLGWFSRKHIEGDFEAFTPPPSAKFKVGDVVCYPSQQGRVATQILAVTDKGYRVSKHYNPLTESVPCELGEFSFSNIEHNRELWKAPAEPTGVKHTATWYATEWSHTTGAIKAKLEEINADLSNGLTLTDIVVETSQWRNGELK